MRIFYDLSKVQDSKTFKYDAQLIQFVKIGLILFLIVSSITVFSGIRSHLTSYMTGQLVVVVIVAYVVCYACFSLLPDYINSVACGYIVSALLRKDLTKEAKIIIAFCLVSVVALSWYSFSMSQNSAIVLGTDIEKSNSIDDRKEVGKIDNELREDLERIRVDHTAKFDAIVALYRDKINGVTQPIDGEVEGLRGQIKHLQNNSSKMDYLYVAKKIEPLQRKVSRLEAKRRKLIAPIQAEQQQAIGDLESKRDQAEAEARNQHRENKDRTTSRTDNYNNTVTTQGQTFTGLLSKLAGYSIFMVLILTIIQTVLYYRNDIKPKPILSNFDFSGSWIVEVVSFPYAYIRSHTTNKVRGMYERLPEAKKTAIEQKIYDGSSYRQAIGNHIEFTDTDGDLIEANIPLSQNLESGQKLSVITDTDNSTKNGFEKRIRGMEYNCFNPGCGNTYIARTYNHSFCSEGCKLSYHRDQNGGNSFDPGKWKTRPKK